jgi:hypothetical protein
LQAEDGKQREQNEPELSRKKSQQNEKTIQRESKKERPRGRKTTKKKQRNRNQRRGERLERDKMNKNSGEERRIVQPGTIASHLHLQQKSHQVSFSSPAYIYNYPVSVTVASTRE